MRKNLLAGAGTALILSAVSYAQTLADITPWEMRPPERPPHDVWLEGEAYSDQSGGKVNADAACFGGKYWTVFGLSKASMVRYAFTVAKPGPYLISVAGQQLGAAWTSPVSYAVDGQWVKAKDARRSEVAWGASREVRWTFLTLAELSAGQHTLAFKVEENRPMDANMSYRIDAIALLHEPFKKIELPFSVGTGQMGNVFTTETPIVFKANSRPPSLEMVWRVTDFYGAEVLSGVWLKGTDIAIPDLPCGYFKFFCKAKGALDFIASIPFARVPPLAARRQNPSNFFCVDTAQSWLSVPGRNQYFPPDSFERTSDLVRLAGIDMVRDRYSFNQINPAPNQYRWDNVYSNNAAMLTARGISVVAVFHDAPKWALGGQSNIPHDLFALYQFAKRSAAQYRDTISAWEFWNEADTSFCNDPVWALSAAQKASHLGFKAGNPAAVSLIGSAAAVPMTRFFELLFENGVRDYFDVFNYHIYKQLGSFPAAVANVTGVLARYGADDKPMWITENGLVHEGLGKGSPLVRGSGLAEHDVVQERLQADHLTKSMVSMQSLGVARNFFFVFPPFNEKEGGKVWGVFRWDQSVKPAYVAFANLTMRLANATYRGRVDVGAGVAAYLYEDGGAQVLVFWSETDDSVAFELSGNMAYTDLYDIMGKKETSRAAGGRISLVARRYITYAEKLSGLKASAPPPSFPAEKPAVVGMEVVLRANLADGFSTHSKTAARISPGGGTLSLDIFNFGSNSETVELKMLNPAFSVGGIPAFITVAPTTVQTVPLTVRVTTPEAAMLSIGGRVGLKDVAPIFIPVFPAFESNSALTARVVPVYDASRWRENSSGSLRITGEGVENSVRFDVQFSSNTDWWVYPEFVLKATGESLAGAIGLSFEIRAKDVSPKGFVHQFVMLVVEDVKEKGKTYSLPYPPPTQEWQTRSICFGTDAPEAFKPSEVKVIRIGMNPKQADFTYWVRNLKIFYKK